MNTCRFCKEQTTDHLIKYGVRHYAHARCGLKAQGAAFLDNLTDWQCGQFPYFVAKEFGLEGVIETRYARAEVEHVAGGAA